MPNKYDGYEPVNGNWGWTTTTNNVWLLTKEGGYLNLRDVYALLPEKEGKDCYFIRACTRLDHDMFLAGMYKSKEEVSSKIIEILENMGNK